MKRVLTSPDTALVDLLKNVLQKAGIPCVVMNEQMAQTIPSPLFQAELWVEREENYAEAVALTKEWLHPSQPVGEPWVCSRCGEKLPSQFTKCWKCGTRKNATT